MKKRNLKQTGLRLLLAFVSLAMAAAIWLPVVHVFFSPGAGQLRSEGKASPLAESIAKRHIQLWEDAENREKEQDVMRLNNPEWDYMGRTFLVLSLANMVIRDEGKKSEYLAAMDRIIDESLQTVDDKGLHYFLLDYSSASSFIQQPARSLFIDGEIALMLGARRLIEEKDSYRDEMSKLVEIIVNRMQESPVMSCESYPNECWMFCNTAALAAVKMHDVLEGEDHSEFFRQWVSVARQRLTQPETGLLISSYTYEGERLDGPEGSSIWMAAYCLRLVDEEFAEFQYQQARKELGCDLLGFGWAREWSESWVGARDIDSGPIIPLLEASAGSSGLAFLGAAAFEDGEFFDLLATSLNFAAFPVKDDDSAIRFCASNQVGDSVLLLSSVCGPLWEEILDRSKSGK